MNREHILKTSLLSYDVQDSFFYYQCQTQITFDLTRLSFWYINGICSRYIHNVFYSDI